MMPSFFASLMGRLVLAAAVVALVLFGVSQCQGRRTAQTAAKVERNRTDAAVQSGRDAVDTVGKAAEREDQLDRTVNDAQAKIDAAPDAVAADAAGRDGLCRIAGGDFCPDPVHNARP